MNINTINVGRNGKIEGNICQGSFSDKDVSARGITPATGGSYDVAVSYASEQEDFVRRVVTVLEEEGLKVFLRQIVDMSTEERICLRNSIIFFDPKVNVQYALSQKNICIRIIQCKNMKQQI